MAPQKRRRRLTILLKSLVLGIICLSFFGVLSCNNTGTGGASSSSTGSGTGAGTGWTITIKVGTNLLRIGDTTTVMAIVKDGSGAPAPNKTNVCMVAVKGCFLQGSNCFSTICGPTSNDLGQAIQTYYASPAFILEATDDTIEVSSQDVIARTTITVTN
jgi:hypothetical protein